MLNLDRLEIHPAKNRGFSITHHFRPRAVNRRGAMRGGMGMEMREPEMHTFGAGEHQKMMNHISNALGLKNVANPEAQSQSEGDGDED